MGSVRISCPRQATAAMAAAHVVPVRLIGYWTHDHDKIKKLPLSKIGKFFSVNSKIKTLSLFDNSV